MVIINNEILKNVYHHLKTIENVILKETNRVNGNKSYLDKIVPEKLSKVYSGKQQTALSFIDNLTRVNYENSVVSLVATFEKIVFAKYRTTYGTLRKVITTNSTKPLDYFDSRERFINDGIEYLSGIFKLLEGNIEESLFKKLIIIKNHRNYIAHGKRDSEPPAVDYPLDTIAEVLDNVIREIEK